MSFYSLRATIRYVKPTATGTGTGLSWANASGDLQATINASSSGDEVWVMAGTYHPTQDNTGNSSPADVRAKTFIMKSGVSVYGSFAGNETILAERTAAVIAANPSILSGDTNGDDVISGSGSTLAISGNSENVYRVVHILALGVSTRLDGFTITGGNANGTPQTGAGVCCTASGNTFILANCVVTGNASASHGGGMFMNPHVPTITNCTFSLNISGGSGGGIASLSATPITNCIISGNRCVFNGGGLWCNVTGTGTVDNCTFSGNYAGTNGGGIHVASTANITGCTLSGNQAATGGGGLYVLSATPTITSCVLTGNTASSGAGMGSSSSNSVVNNCILHANTATAIGGGMWNSGSSPVVTNCVFSGNTAVQNGGGIANFTGAYPTTPSFINCLITGNTVTGGLGTGGGMFNQVENGATLLNCIVWNNPTASTSDAGREELYQANTTYPLNVSYSLVRDAFPITNVTDGGNNSNSTPLFTNAADPNGADNIWFTADDGFHPDCGSPAVNRSATTTGTDITGSAILGTYRDLGAYESTRAQGGRTLVETASTTTTADYECTDGTGWTHYFEAATDRMLLSVKKNGNNIGTVGAGGFAVTSNTNATWGTGAATAISAPYVSNPNGWFVMNRWWNVTPTTQPSSDVQVRVYFTAQDLADVNGSLSGADLSAQQLTFYKINGGNASLSTGSPHAGVGSAAAYDQTGYWQYTNGASASSSQWALGNFGSGQYAEYTIRSFSGGGGGGSVGGGSAFPVEFADIQAFWLEANQQARIEWTTASELNVSHFVVERSTDGLLWSEVRTVAAQGAGLYSIDDQVFGVVNQYYRILSVDLDGQETLSKTVVLAAESTHQQPTVWPNPAHDRLLVKTLSGGATIRLYSLTGQLINMTQLDENQVFVELSLQHLPAGMYQIEIIADGARTLLPLQVY